MAPIDARAKLEQIRRYKKKQGPSGNKTNSGNVKDLRQIIAKKSKRKNERSPNRTAQGRVTKQTRPNSKSRVNDLRDTNKKLASRRNASQTRDRNITRTDTRSNRTVRSAPTPNKRSAANPTRSVRMGSRLVPEQQYYTPPHVQRSQPTYILAEPKSSVRQPNLARDSLQTEPHGGGGASILISNLSHKATQSDIIEIFGNVGVMTAVNIINQTTALVTYQNSSDAVRAVKFYNNRLLDGEPMLVNMMPNNI